MPEPTGPSDHPSASALPALPTPNPAPTVDAVSPALVGLTQPDAEAKATAAGYTTRIGSVDGQPRALTMDYRFDRITLDVEAGRVVRASAG